MQDEQPHDWRRYRKGCRCDDCRTSSTRRRDQDRRRHAYGWTSTNVPNDEARTRFLELREQGMTYNEITAASGVPRGTFGAILRPGGSIRTATANAIINAEGRPSAPDGFMDPLATRRRIQGLQRMGHPIRAIAEASGVGVYTLRVIAHGERALVRRRVAQGVAEAARSLVVTAPRPDRYTTAITNSAISKGWIPLVAWDDIADPHETPKGIGEHTDARWEHLHHDVEELARQGVTRDQIATRLGRKWHSIQDTYRRNNTPLPPELRTSA